MAGCAQTNSHTYADYPAQQAYVAQPYGNTSKAEEAEAAAAAAGGEGYTVAGQTISQQSAHLAAAGVGGAALGAAAGYVASGANIVSKANDSAHAPLPPHKLFSSVLLFFYLLLLLLSFPFLF